MQLAVECGAATGLVWRRTANTAPVKHLRRVLPLFRGLTHVEILDAAIGDSPSHCAELGAVLADSVAAAHVTSLRLAASSCLPHGMREFCKHLRRLPRLASLTLAGRRRTAFDASVVAELGGCHALTSLTLTHAVNPNSPLGTTSRLVKALQGLTQLTNLDFVDERDGVEWHKFHGASQRAVADVVLNAMLPLGAGTYFYLSSLSNTTAEHYHGYASVAAWRRRHEPSNTPGGAGGEATAAGSHVSTALRGRVGRVADDFHQALQLGIAALWVCGPDHDAEVAAYEVRYDALSARVRAAEARAHHSRATVAGPGGGTSGAARVHVKREPGGPAASSGTSVTSERADPKGSSSSSSSSNPSGRALIEGMARLVADVTQAMRTAAQQHAERATVSATQAAQQRVVERAMRALTRVNGRLATPKPAAEERGTALAGTSVAETVARVLRGPGAKPERARSQGAPLVWFCAGLCSQPVVAVAVLAM